jgi:hypothetical protein
MRGEKMNTTLGKKYSGPQERNISSTVDRPNTVVGWEAIQY